MLLMTEWTQVAERILSLRIWRQYISPKRRNVYHKTVCELPEWLSLKKGPETSGLCQYVITLMKMDYRTGDFRVIRSPPCKQHYPFWLSRHSVIVEQSLRELLKRKSSAEKQKYDPHIEQAMALRLSKYLRRTRCPEFRVEGLNM